MFIDEDHDSGREQAIQTLLNNAMGRAGRSLGKVIGSEVEVSVPATHWVNNHNLQTTLGSLQLPEKSIVMRQSFRGKIRGEVLILLEHGAKHYQLGQVMGYEGEMSRGNIQELTLELANILSGACISGLSEQLNLALTFDAPSLLSEQTSVDDILTKRQLQWTDALFMDVGYTVRSIAMTTHIILAMTEEDSHSLYHYIDQQLGQ